MAHAWWRFVVPPAIIFLSRLVFPSFYVPFSLSFFLAGPFNVRDSANFDRAATLAKAPEAY
ncbi:hypothetical protein BDZ89DRAFT_165666 [Hymenopellis radicata]|nr:hypothetical protein BDZ89DRAFT_165666 [Hymenopellis radicata]